MTIATGSNSAPVDANSNSSVASNAPSGWREMRANDEIQFEPVDIPPIPPREPSWIDEVMRFLAELFAPLGQLFGSSWPIVKWVLIALAIAAVLFIAWRLLEPIMGLQSKSAQEEDDMEWQPDRQQSLALLEDADRLAAEGRYDEAVRMLLQRSVGQIASARPDWVAPSSTARELAALPMLSDAARSTFQTIAERVERSLFALRALDAEDWEAARKAYADFALAKIETSKADRNRIDAKPAWEAEAAEHGA